MTTARLYSKKQVALFIAAALLLVFSARRAWNYLTSPTGEQKVEFIAANAKHYTSGKLDYTVYQARSGVTDEVIYHLHGRKLDGTIWNDDTYYTSQVQAFWQQHGVKPPTVVVVSYGPEWLLTPKNSHASSGLMDDFISHLPEIESRIGKPSRRILLGESMGGLNVLILGLSHPELFSKIASLCPGVYLGSPFYGFSTLRTGMKRTGADPKVIYGIKRLAKRYASNKEEWDRIDPIRLIERADRTYPELYLSCGLYDKYGNFEGTEALANRARAKGVVTQWHPLYGGHCAIDVASLADFLTARS